jgi:hypothetical protein
LENHLVENYHVKKDPVKKDLAENHHVDLGVCHLADLAVNLLADLVENHHAKKDLAVNLHAKKDLVENALSSNHLVMMKKIPLVKNHLSHGVCGEDHQ